MRCMCLAPVIVRGESEDAKNTPRPIVEATAREEGAMATIVLDHEQAQQKCCGRNNQDQAPPEVIMHCQPGQHPEGTKGTAVISSSKVLRPVCGVRYFARIFSQAFSSEPSADWGNNGVLIIHDLPSARQPCGSNVRRAGRGSRPRSGRRPGRFRAPGAYIAHIGV